jgi:hypothetical protein
MGVLFLVPQLITVEHILLVIGRLTASKGEE